MDGRQLGFPGTGLAVVTSEILRAMAETPETPAIRVYVDDSVEPDAFGLESEKLHWARIQYSRGNPDYLDRLSWAGAVRAEIRRSGAVEPLFVPYLYNYGALRSNVVLIPDLVYREFPDYGKPRTGQRFWQLRGRLPFRPLMRWWEERRASVAKKIVVYSRFVRKQVHEYLRVPLERIEVVDLAAPRWIGTTENSKPKVELPARFALYTGGYAARKNVPMLLRACGGAWTADPSFRCLFVGLQEALAGGNEDLHPALNEPGVAAAVIPAGRLSHAEMSWVYRNCEFALYPSHSEGFGLPVIESATCGKICLCGDNSSLREVQSNAALRIETGNPRGWTESIQYYWRNPELTARLGEASRAEAKRYDWKRTAEKLWRLFLNPSANPTSRAQVSVAAGQ